MESQILRIVVALGVPGLALGVFYLLLKKFNFQFRPIRDTWAAIIAILFLLIGGGITWYALYKWAPDRQDRKVESVTGRDLTDKSSWVARRKYIWTHALHRVVYCAGLHQEADKITGLVFLQLSNRGERPRRVLGYKVEIFHDGGWQPFGSSHALRSDASTYVEVVLPGRTDPTYVDLTGKELDRALAGNIIPPGAVVEGYTFLNYYRGPMPELNAVSDLRMMIEDSDGQSGIYTILQPPENDVGRDQMLTIGFKNRGWRPPCTEQG
jgi:hypothetical protein